MSARVDPDVQAASSASASLQTGALAGPAAIAYDADDRYGGNALPSDHPKWMKDTLSISQRARTFLSQLKPVALQVITFWEHRVRSISIGGRKLSIDPSGSYRFD